MTTYIGTKVITAKPMNRLEYNQYRGWKLPDNENGNDEGYLVEYFDGGMANDPRHFGYISWSPKNVFERSYKDSSNGFDFGDAIRLLKSGFKVARKGWNGKGMWLVLVEGTKEVNLKEGSVYAVATGQQTCEILPHIGMWTVNSEGRRAMLPGWLASQTDMLSNDWVVAGT